MISIAQAKKAEKIIDQFQDDLCDYHERVCDEIGSGGAYVIGDELTVLLNPDSKSVRSIGEAIIKIQNHTGIKYAQQIRN